MQVHMRVQHTHTHTRKKLATIHSNDSRQYENKEKKMLEQKIFKFLNPVLRDHQAHGTTDAT